MGSLKVPLLAAALALGTLHPAFAQTFEDRSDLLAGYARQDLTVGGDAIVGAAWLDYDRDGRLDLFLPGAKNQPNALFHNDGDGTFSDVAVSAGVAGGQGHNGVVAADFDDDGFPDLFLGGTGGMAGFEHSAAALYRNRGDGTFEDVIAGSGIDAPDTALSAAAADVDGDGRLDLFIAAAGSLARKVQFGSKLYRNRGSFRFVEITRRAGVGTTRGACVNAFTDADGDGRVDLLVGDCNDVTLAPTPIELFSNRGGGRFADVTVEAGLDKGGYWMGVCPADFDRDGDIDVFATNFGSFLPFTPHALYRNEGDGTFVDVAAESGLADLEFGWGCSSADLDNDGWADLFFAGSLPPFDVIGTGKGNPGTHLWNDHGRGFVDRTGEMPVDLSGRFTTGVATGDYDNDGFPDVVVTTSEIDGDGGRPVLLHNLGGANNWIALDLEGTTSNRDAIGARVRVRTAGQTQTRELRAGSSVVSTDSHRLHFGLGEHASADSVEVRWPSGRVDTLRDIGANQVLRIVESRAAPRRRLSVRGPAPGAPGAGGRRPFGERRLPRR